MGHRSVIGAGITENMCSHDIVMLLILSPFNNEEYWCGFKMTADFTGLKFCCCYKQFSWMVSKNAVLTKLANAIKGKV